MRIRDLSLTSAAIGLAFLIMAESSLAARPRSPNTGSPHPTYASQQAKRRTAYSYRASARSYSVPVQSRRSFSYQPRVDVAFKAGERARVVGDGVALMRGHEVLATLKKGQEITILKVQGKWLGTSIESAGESKAGWVAAGNVVEIADPPTPTTEAAEDSDKSQPRTIPCHQTSHTKTNGSGTTISHRRYASGVSSYWKERYGLLAREWDPNAHERNPWE